MADDDFAPVPADTQRALDKLYDGNAAQPPHSYSPAIEVIDRRDRELFSEAGLDATQRAQLRQTYTEIGRIGLPDGVVAQIANADMDTRVAATRVKSDADADAAALAQDQQIQANNAELREKFVAQYGAKDGEQLLERTQRFVRSHPKLAAILKENGIGSRIDIVEGIAAHVFSNGIR